MRDGSVLAVGKGNPEWNYSAPHGAGRLMSRNAAKERLNIEEYRNIISAWTGRDAEEYYKDIIHNAEDKFQDLFYEKTIEDFTCSYIENRDVEEGEDEENREVVLVY